jgi:hypothetical protein
MQSTLPHLDRAKTEQDRLVALCTAGGDKPSPQQFAAASLLICSGHVISKLCRAPLQEMNRKPYAGLRHFLLIRLSGYLPEPSFAGWRAYAHLLVEAIKHLQLEAEKTLAGGVLYGDSKEGEEGEELYKICSIFPELLVQRSHVQPPSYQMEPRLAVDNIIVDGLCEVGIDLCSFIMEEDETIANLRLPETAPELAAVLMAGGRVLDQELSSRANMHAIRGLLPALETIHAATSKAMQTLLDHDF